MTKVPNTSSAQPRIYRLYETIYHSGCEYGSDIYFVASSEKEIIEKARMHLAEYCEQEIAQKWTLVTQSEKFEEEYGFRSIRVEVEEISDIYEYLEIASARPQIQIVVRGGVVQDVKGIEDYSILDYDEVNAGGIFAHEIIETGNLVEVGLNEYQDTVSIPPGKQLYTAVTGDDGPDVLVVGLKLVNRLQCISATISAGKWALIFPLKRNDR